MAVLLGSWAFWLVLQITLVFIGTGMRYHRVLRAAHLPSGVDIEGFYTWGRTQGDRILRCPGEHRQQVVFVKTTEQSFLSQTYVVRGPLP